MRLLLKTDYVLRGLATGKRVDLPDSWSRISWRLLENRYGCKNPIRLSLHCTIVVIFDFTLPKVLPNRRH